MQQHGKQATESEIDNGAEVLREMLIKLCGVQRLARQIQIFLYI